MTWIVFVIYLALFSWIVTRMPFIRRSGLSRTLLLVLFLVKIAAGIAYFQFHSLPQYRHRADTWKYYEQGVAQAALLKQSPATFVSDLFQHKYKNSGGMFSDRESYWNDLKDASFIKLFAVVNVCTGNNYYAAIIFFNFVFFLGLVAFYRLLAALYPGRRNMLLAAIFLVPSFLFRCRSQTSSSTGRITTTR